ncbi:uncharacterized protein RHIMIDRAFT_236254 [Rhizopus microsporus ATCC 52813]|uniref:Uncharacterized protein n=2 Tax=Rhizopus microsporus TaxID=58291 RepID=A0A2G4SZU4_RHIZD|nr:uncharacterized protein RHIMIDRAFT_236254 [Rhizopus microsporus ATCC 52813]PHZ14271.1 hypothetical protein RHIMIDRAFT_236254 [Rhizopus microsporus ATCC 52813]
MKFANKLFFEQNNQKLVCSLKTKFGHDAVLIFGDWSAPNTKYHEPTRNKDLISMLKKSGFSVYLIKEYKTSSYYPTCESGLKTFKTVPNPHPYQRSKDPNIVCHGLLKRFKEYDIKLIPDT